MILKEGEIFHGRYCIVSKLGEGSVGSVYRATQIDSGREVALKLLHASSNATEIERERFLREFRILAQLSSEHIVTFYSAAISAEGFPYAVFELISGQDLFHAITEAQRMPYERTLKIAEQICVAMEYAHNQGIIHRDLKPENIMLLEKPEHDWVKILDFGFARDESQNSSKQKLTATGVVVGTVCYLSPEQCRGGKASVQSDIYALACIIYECIAGKLLFEADSPLSVVHKQINEDPLPALKLLQPLVPFGFIAVLKKALDKDPSRRQSSMRELRSDLLALPKEIGVAPPISKKVILRYLVGALIIVGIVAGSVAIFQSIVKSNLNAETMAKPAKLTKLLSVQNPQALIDDAVKLMEKHDYAGAELRLKLAREKAHRERNSECEFRAQVLLTQVSLKTKDIPSGRVRARETVETAKKYFGKDSNEYFNALQVQADSFVADDPTRAKQILASLLLKFESGNKVATLTLVEVLDKYTELLQKDGEGALADAELTKSKALFENPAVNPNVKCLFLVLQARSKFNLGKKAEAEQLAKQGTDLSIESDGLRDQQRVTLLVMWAELYSHAGDLDRAIQLIEEAQHRLRSSGADMWLAELYIAEANMFMDARQNSKALIPLDKAYTLVDPTKRRAPNVLVSEIIYEKAICYKNLGDLEQAHHLIEDAIATCPVELTEFLVRCSDLRKEIETKLSKK